MVFPFQLFEIVLKVLYSLFEMKLRAFVCLVRLSRYVNYLLVGVTVVLDLTSTFSLVLH